MEQPLFSYISGRSLLQTNGTEVQRCDGIACFAFSMIAICLALFIVSLIILKCWWDIYRYKVAISEGCVPAEMLVQYWLTAPSERGDVTKFKFNVRRPKNKDELKEESCPVCLTESSWDRWVIFSCGHSTCGTCFKEIASRQKLHAACPMCRQLLAEGEGNRGGKKPEPVATDAQTTEGPDAV